MTVSYTTTVRNAKLDAVTTAVGAAGLLRIYDATGGVPASANVAITTQVLLAELVCGTPFAPGASGGVLTANAVSNDVSANATGTAAFFRVTDAAGTTTVYQGTAGTAATDLVLNTTSLVIGGPVAVSSLTITAGNA